MVKENPSFDRLQYLWNSVEYIITTPAIESKQTTAEHESQIRGQYNQLLNHLTSVSEIAAQMFQAGKLTAKELEHVQQFHSAPIKASEELLNIIIRRPGDVYESFLQSLKTTKQHDLCQMLTMSIPESDQAGDEFAPEHCRLIRQNYAFLTESLDPDHGLLSILLEKYVLSCREYEQIRLWKDRFKKNEILLSYITRKSPADFKEFLDALIKSNQSEIGKRLKDIVVVDALESEQRFKGKAEGYTSTLEKKIPPNVPPKPKVQPHSASAQQGGLHTPVACPSKPSCGKSVVEKHHKAIQHEMNKRRFSKLEAQFKELQNELEAEVSTKLVLLRLRRSNDNMLKICFQKILQGSQTHRVQSQGKDKLAEDKCERLRQDILQERRKFIFFQDDIEREKAETEKQLTVLQERIYDLEKSLKSCLDAYGNLSRKLQESELMIEKLKAKSQRNEQESVARENLASTQLSESVERLRFLETETCKLYQLKEVLEKKVAMHVDFEERYHRESFELRGTCKALETELASVKCRLQELEETDTDSSLRGCEKKLEETEWKLMLRLKEAEAKLTIRECFDESMANDCKVKIFDLEQKLEQERNAWREEKEHLIKQLEEQRRLIVKFGDIYRSDPVLVQTINSKAATKKRKPIYGVAILDKELFVVSSEVEVYDSMKFSLKFRLKLKELILPKDIGSCNRNQCLYIFDFKCEDRSKEILRVDPSGKLIKTWSTGDDYGRLSVTYESNVIFIVHLKSQLYEYSSDGQLIREISLLSDADIHHPYYAIKLTNGHFVVSHGDFAEGGLHRVCVVDEDGKLIKSFGGTPGSTVGQLNHPNYLSVDGKGYVMVADRMTSRVLLLYSDLEFKREILSKEKHGLRHPTSILLDEPSGRLFVVDNELGSGGRILIFTLRYM